MSVVLREPKDQIYVQEKMPFIFSSEKMESRAQEINSRVSRHNEEANKIGVQSHVTIQSLNKVTQNQNQRPYSSYSVNKKVGTMNTITPFHFEEAPKIF